MAKKPRLTLVDQTTPTVLSPPTTLGKIGSLLWQTVMTEYDIRDSGGREMLRQICEAADRVDEFSKMIARDGPTIRTKTGLRDHPLLKHELASRGFVVKSLHRLGLDVEPVGGIGRPTQAIGGGAMPTNRTPIRRQTKFTPQAIEIFTRMVATNCSGAEYDKLGRELRHELRLTTAEGYPPIVFPWHEPLRDELGPAGRWEREKGPRLFRELCQAAGIDPKDFEEEETTAAEV